MKKLNEIQLKENWEKLISLVTDTFSGERQTKLLKMYKHFEERMKIYKEENFPVSTYIVQLKQ